MNIVFYVYLLIMNVVGFAFMAWDKEKAKSQGWRIPEKRFFCIAILGGSIGCWLGMQKFRHKTKHPKFVIGMPLIIFLQLLTVVIMYGTLFWTK